MSQFEKIIAMGDKARNELNLKESDIDVAIRDVRKRKNAHSS
jgi:soluble P-type ATPase